LRNKLHCCNRVFVQLLHSVTNFVKQVLRLHVAVCCCTALLQYTYNSALQASMQAALHLLHLDQPRVQCLCPSARIAR
jgi:hypothetical protein